MTRHDTFTVFKKYKKPPWIYWEKLLLQAWAILILFISKITFFTDLDLNSSSLKKLYILRISKSQKWRKFKKNKPQTKFIGSSKTEFLPLIIANFTMDNCTHNFKNTLISSSHANFRLDNFFHSKTLFYSFGG